MSWTVRTHPNHQRLRQLLVLCLLLALLPWHHAGAAASAVPHAESTRVPTVPLSVAIAISIADAEVTEVDTNQTAPINFLVTLSAPVPTGAELTVDFATANGTAEAGIEYQAITGTLTFAAGESEKQITVTTIGNDVYRPTNKQFVVNLANPQITNDGGGALTGVSLADAQATGTIVQDEPTPALSVSNVTVVEGTDNFARINLSITPASETPVSLRYGLTACLPSEISTNEDCATVGEDFSNVPTATLIFGGSGSESISIEILNDDIPEVDEVLFIRLFDPQDLTFPKSQSEVLIRVVIRDQDFPVARLAATTYTIAENGGVLAVPVVLNYPPARTYQSRVALELVPGGTATAGADFTLPSILTLGSTMVTGTLNIGIRNDTIQEPDEFFEVRLTTAFSGSNPPPPNASIGTPNQARITIENDDGTSRFSVTGQGRVEGGQLRFQVRLDPISLTDATVEYVIDPGDSRLGLDYTLLEQYPLTGTLNFATGNTTKDLFIQTVDNALDQTDRTFTITLSNPQPPESVSLSQTTFRAVAVIDDNDGPSIAFERSSSTTTENGGMAIIAVRLSAPSPQPVSVSYATSPLTATAGVDYRTTNGTLTFPPQTSVQTVSVPILNNYAIDEERAFELVLSRPTDGTLGEVVRHRVTIVDDEGPPALRFSRISYPVSEGTGVATITIESLITAPRTEDFVVTVSSRDDTAVAGKDYTAFSRQITFDASVIPAADGQGVFTPTVLTRVVTTTITNDTFQQPERVFLVELSNPASDAVLASPTSARVQIIDDDQPARLVYLPFVLGTPPQAVFTQPSYSVSERTGSLTVQIKLEGGARTTSTVGYRTLQNSAQPGRDYEEITGTLTFVPSGPDTQTITVTVLDNTVRDGNRIFLLLLENPQGDIQLGGVSGASVTITDDDLGLSQRVCAPLDVRCLLIGGWHTVAHR